MTTESAMNRPEGRRSAARLFAVYWLPAMLYVALIFMVSSKPYLAPPVKMRYADKVAHLIEYCGLGLLMSRALRASRPGMRRGAAAVTVIAVGAAIATCDEWFQTFIPGRASTLSDGIADTVGLTLAQLLPRGILPE